VDVLKEPSGTYSPECVEGESQKLNFAQTEF
jgi:hypothetical protein